MKTETEIKARPAVNYLDSGLAIVKAMTQVGFKAGTQSKKILNTMLALFNEFHADAGIDDESMVKDESIPIQSPRMSAARTARRNSTTSIWCSPARTTRTRRTSGSG